jgi:hypothetical protein
MFAAAEEGNERLFRKLEPSDDEFLAACGVVGLGRLVAEGRSRYLGVLRGRASDPRWRVREAVAMWLQRIGDVDMEELLRVAEEWGRGSPFEQRAAAGALCEPRLLSRKRDVTRVLRLLDRMTSGLARSLDRRDEGHRVLRKGLGYCWSVAVVAHPAAGKRAMERWIPSDDPDIRWVMKENLKKARLTRMDSEWVARSLRSVGTRA